MSRLETLAVAEEDQWKEQPEPVAPQRRYFSLLLGGSLVMLLGSGLVSVINFGFNVAMARMLEPDAFASVTAAVTMLMLFSAVSLSFQLVAAKFVALNRTLRAQAGLYRELMRRSWVVGILSGATLALLSVPVANYLHMDEPWEITVLALGIGFYIPLGVKRGAMQGLCQFGRLSGNFLVEAAVRAVAAVALVALGYGVAGAVGAISVSVFVSFLLPTGLRSAIAGAPICRASFGEGMQATVFFVGQVVINNLDILLVKHFFNGTEAGMYAAVALVGRVLYYCSWSVVSAMFPISAAAKHEEHRARVLGVPLLVVFLMSVAAIVGLGLFAKPVVSLIFGARFQQIEPLLWLYAAKTGLYALSVVMIAYEMSRKIANTGWLQLFISGIMVAGITLFHGTLHQVIMVQLVLMVVLLALVSLPFVKGTQATIRLEEAA